MNKLEKEIKILKKLINKQKSSTFSCVECGNQHQQILDWLIELKDYEDGKVGINKENSSIKGYMSLQEAINHTQDVININKNKTIINKHKELLD